MLRKTSMLYLIKATNKTRKKTDSWSLFGTAHWRFASSSDSKESAHNVKEESSMPGLGWSPGEGNGNPLQYSCLENSVDRGARRKEQDTVSGYHFDFTGGWVGGAVRGQCCCHWITLGSLVRGPLGKMPLGKYLLMEHLSMTCNKVANYA